MLLRVPYQGFQLEFISGDKITVQRNIPSKNKNVDPTDHLECKIILSSKQHIVPLIIWPSSTVVRQISETLGYPWRYIGEGRWQDPRDGEVRDVDDLATRTWSSLPAEIVEQLRRKPKNEALEEVQREALEKVRRKCKVLLIGTDRLQSNISGHSDIAETHDRFHSLEWSRPPRRRSPGDGDTRRIAEYSRDLIRRFREEHTRYGALTERLDRSFVRRLLRQENPKKTAQELLGLFKDLDDKRRELTRLGLLTVQQEDVLGESARDAGAVLYLVSKSTDVFSLYVRDMQEKLALFDGLQRRLQILRSRMDQRFQFKKLIIDPAKGFMFESATGSKIGPNDLSSGEQHEMVLFYYLLFMAGEGDLVLIDEPEISLHIEWQMALAEDIKAALALRESSFDVLMATHSPAIAQGVGRGYVPLGPRKS